jgi:hypothetical protein
MRLFDDRIRRDNESVRQFPISYDDMGPISVVADRALGGGPERGRVEVHADRLVLRMADFTIEMPRDSVREVTRSMMQTHGTIGVHAKDGQWLANGSAAGLVDIELEPPCHTHRCLSTLFLRRTVNSVVVSLADPEGFIASIEGWEHEA